MRLTPYEEWKALIEIDREKRMAYEAPYCKLCGSKHPLGRHTAFGPRLERVTSSRGAGGEKSVPSTPSGLQQGAVTNSRARTERKERRSSDAKPGAANVAKPQPAPREAVIRDRTHGGQATMRKIDDVSKPKKKAKAAKKSKPAKKAKAAKVTPVKPAFEVKPGRPTEEARKAKQTLTAIKPWKAEGISRAQWYKRKAKAK